MFFDRKRWLHDPLYAIKVTWVTTIVVVALSVAIYVAADVWPDVLQKFRPGLLDVAIIAALGYGVFRRSRVCAVLLLGFWLYSNLFQIFKFQVRPGAKAILISSIF